MLSNGISSDLLKSDLVQDNNLQKEFDILDDLSNIVSAYVVFYNSPKYASPIDEAYEEFVKTVDADRYRKYYN